MKEKILALPLRCVDYSNSSQIVSLFSREQGLVEGIAKGAHRPKNAFHGPFDLAVLYEVLYLERRSAGLAILTDATVLDGFRPLRRLWERYVATCHVIEFLRTVVVPGEGVPELFDVALATLKQLETDDGGGIQAALASFDLSALRVLGLWSTVPACGACQKPWSGSDQQVFFSVRSGSLLCSSCRRHANVTGRLVPGQVVRALHRLAESRSPAAAAGRPLPAVNRDVRSLVGELRTNLLERDLVLLKSSSRWLGRS